MAEPVEATRPVKRDSHLSDDVYRQLRSQIVRGVLRPNEALVEADIAERLGVSRTPVRESLQRLSADGLIVSRRRRWAVYEHTRDEVVELYEVRAALEGHAARLAAERAGEDELAEMADMVGDVTALETRGRERVELNERFHDMVDRASHNSQLVTQIMRNRLFAFNYRVASAYSPEQYAASWAQHQDLVTALAQRDVDRAGELARRHVEYSLALIINQVF